MIAHEVAGVAIASLVVLAFVSAIKPGSQMGTLLSNSLSGWAGVLNAVRGTQPGA